MNDAPTPLQPRDPATHADRVQAALWRQHALLEQLAEAGLRAALTLEQQAAAAPPEDPRHAAMAFARVARAVRMAVLLQSRLIKDMDEAHAKALDAAPQVEEEVRLAEARERARLDPADGYKARVERIVGRQVEARHRGDEDRVRRLMVEASERLDDDDIYGDVLTRPMGELVALICRDLGVEPDWARLAEEAWAQAEIESGVEGSPFNSFGAARAPSFAAANGGEGELCDRQGRSCERPPDGRAGLADPGVQPAEERLGVGEGGFRPPFDGIPDRPHTWGG